MSPPSLLRRSDLTIKPYEKYLQPCVFERAGKNVDVSAAYALADKRPMFPSPNEMYAAPLAADRNYEFGCAYGTLDPAKAPLPILEFNVFTDYSGAEINRVLQSGTSHRPDITCFSLCATFIACSDSVVCHLNLGDSNGGSEEERDTGIFRIIDHRSGGIELQIDAFDCTTFCIRQPQGIEDIIRWLYVAWRGIQYKLILSPDEFTVHEYDLSERDYKFYTDNYADICHIVRTISGYVIFGGREKEADKDA